MHRKKNTEEESPPVEQPETEPPMEEPEALTEEPTREPEEEVDAPEDAEDPQEEPEEEPSEEPTEEPETEPAADQTEALRNQLLQAQGELAAFRAGVVPNMVADAVTLAMAEAAKAGAVTETSVAAAMEAVLKRHPEWKVSQGSKQKGGFRIGADRDNGGAPRKNEAPQNTKRWNRYK